MHKHSYAYYQTTTEQGYALFAAIFHGKFTPRRRSRIRKSERRRGR